MNIGIVCYASIGGSGIVATELGKALAARGHDVHILSTDTPFRLGDYQPGLSFHRVDTPSLSAVSRAAVPAVAGQQDRAGRARASGSTSSTRTTRFRTRRRRIWRGRFSRRPRRRPASRKVITTLHGTDITLLGSDPSYSETVAFSIEQSDGVTAVSESLRADTYRELGVKRDIEVIPEFPRLHALSAHRQRRRSRQRYCPRRARRSSSTCRTSGR